MRLFVTGMTLSFLVLAIPLKADTLEGPEIETTSQAINMADGDVTRRLIQWECQARPIYGSDVSFTASSQYFWQGTGEDQQARENTSRMAVRRCQRLTKLQCESFPERDCWIMQP